MPIEYKTVDTSTLEGLEQAERLKAQGWTIYGVGLHLIRFYKITKSEGRIVPIGNGLYSRTRGAR